MKILLLVSEPVARDALQFFLEARFLTEVVSTSLLINFYTSLERDPSFDLIVCEYAPLSRGLTKGLTERKIKIPILVIADSKLKTDAIVEDGIIGFLDSRKIFESFTSTFSGSIKGKRVERAKEKEGYCRIKTELLFHLNPVTDDLFVKLPDDKLIKVLGKGDIFTQEDYQAFPKNMQSEFFLIKRENHRNILDKFKDQIARMITYSGQKLFNPCFLIEDLSPTIQFLYQALQIDSEQQKKISGFMPLALKVIGKNSNLTEQFKVLALRPRHYIAAHSVALAQLTSILAILSDQGSDQNLAMLSIAALLHDLPLSSDELASLRNFEQVEKKRELLAPDAELHFRSHPTDASNLTQQFTSLSPEIATILLQHHELPDGSGFPNKVDHTRLSPLSSIFIFAHDLLNVAYETSPEVLLDHFITARKKKYSVGFFKTILIAVETRKKTALN